MALIINLMFRRFTPNSKEHFKTEKRKNVEYVSKLQKISILNARARIMSVHNDQKGQKFIPVDVHIRERAIVRRVRELVEIW